MKKLLFFISCFSLILSGCSENTSTLEKEKEKEKVKVIEKDNDNLIQVFNPFINKFISYNTKTNLPEEDKSIADKPNTMQYSFNTKSDYYTKGDSYNFHFEIVKLEEGAVKSVYKLENEKTEAIFPLAIDGKDMFFITTDYSNSEEPISTIVKYEDKSLKEYDNAKGNISSNGVIFNGKLHYTVYDKNSNSYSLFSLDYSQYTNEPELVQSNIEGRELFVLNNKLYVSNDKQIYTNDGDSFNKQGENFYNTESNTLIHVFYTEGENQLSLKLIDAGTKEEIKIIDNVVGFNLEKGELVAYCLGEIVRVKLT
ncbi:hypothetical protein [Bacillus coreaensis]